MTDKKCWQCVYQKDGWCSLEIWEEGVKQGRKPVAADTEGCFLWELSNDIERPNNKRAD